MNISTVRSAVGGQISAVLAALIVAAVSLTAAPGRDGLVAPPATAPANLKATPGNARITLTWNSVPTATSYRIYRTTTGTFGSTALATVSTTSYANTGLVNGTAYSYRVTARNSSGEGPVSVTVTATPVPPPPVPVAPSALIATGGNQQVALSWPAVSTATSYRVYRSVTSGTYSSTIAATVQAPSTAFVNTGLENGPLYFYTVIAVNSTGAGPRSPEASAYTEPPPLVADAQTIAAFQLLRQSTWGPRPGDIERVKSIGRDAFLAEQFAAAPSAYPDTLLTLPMIEVQQHLFQTALTGPDQLRQRVAWALHKIWVVSALDPDAAAGMVPYLRILSQQAFGNYRDLMEAVTTTPAMGHYLTMLNNRSQAITGAPANENYAREVMQLFTIGTSRLNPDGTPVIGADEAPAPSYTEDDVKALARILTGWTFGDGDASTAPAGLAATNYRVPMEPAAALHDTTAKTFLGESFPAGVSASDEMDHALDVLFRHPNVGPFVAAQLIKQLVKSNPSRAYTRDVAAVFDNNGSGVRGDMSAVVRAILTHPEGTATDADAGKLAEPFLFTTTFLRCMNVTAPSLKLMVDRMTNMGQRVLYPPSVFSYFSPRFVVRGISGAGGAALTGPEFQGLTSATALERANLVAELLGRYWGTMLQFEPLPFETRARDAVALVDYCNLLVMGGRMGTAERTEIIAAVRAIKITSITERVSTALYLTWLIAQAQVDR